MKYFVRKGVADVWRSEVVARSVQRLVLILPVEEQTEDLVVREEGMHVQVCKES